MDNNVEIEKVNESLNKIDKDLKRAEEILQKLVDHFKNMNNKNESEGK